MDLTVICVNNLNYGMTGGQQAPTTPFGAKTTTSPHRHSEEPFNFCSPGGRLRGRLCGPLDRPSHPAGSRTPSPRPCRRRGFAFVEILAPCPTSFGRRNRMGGALDTLKFFHERSVIRNHIDPKEAVLDFNKQLVVGQVRGHREADLHGQLRG